MLLGKPFCQVVGAFQGREEAFSDSAVLQPLPPKAPATTRTARMMNRKNAFIINK